METRYEPLSDIPCAWRATQDAIRARVVVNSVADMTRPLTDEVYPPLITAEGTGSFTLTITCRDGETSVSGSSTIVVAN